MIPNCFPQNDNQLDTIMNIFYQDWKLETTLSDVYIKLYKQILQQYSILEKNTFDIIFNDQLFKKYPIIDYFFFHMVYRTNFRLNPSTGISVYDQYKFVGLEYRPPFLYTDMSQLK
jgi:hypothetical protein